MGKSDEPEKLICFDYRLSDLDSQLAWSYMRALEQSKDPFVLKQSQKKWLAVRGQCTKVNCIIDAYVKRIEVLMPGENLNAIYFPKPDILWDFLPKPGFEIAGHAQINDNKLEFATFPKGALSPEVALIIPESEDRISKYSGHGTTTHLQRLPIVDRKFRQITNTAEGKLIDFGELHLAHITSSYGECEGGISLSGIYVARNFPWTKNNVLVQLRPKNWTPYKYNDASCEEAETGLKIYPVNMEAVVFDGYLYLAERARSDFVIRLDSNLQTASTLLGKKLYFGWGNDLQELTGNVCEIYVKHFAGATDYYTTKHRICIDEQLQKLIGEITRFYN